MAFKVAFNVVVNAPFKNELQEFQSRFVISFGPFGLVLTFYK